MMSTLIQIQAIHVNDPKLKTMPHGKDLSNSWAGNEPAQQMDMRESSLGCTFTLPSIREVYIKAIIPWWKIQNICLFGAAVSPDGSL